MKKLLLSAGLLGSLLVAGGAIQCAKQEDSQTNNPKQAFVHSQEGMTSVNFLRDGMQYPAPDDNFGFLVSPGDTLQIIIPGDNREYLGEPTFSEKGIFSLIEKRWEKLIGAPKDSSKGRWVLTFEAKNESTGALRINIPIKKTYTVTVGVIKKGLLEKPLFPEGAIAPDFPTKQEKRTKSTRSAQESSGSDLFRRNVINM